MFDLRCGEDVGRWVCKKLGCQFQEGAQGVGLDKDGELVAAVLYDNWNRRTIMAHIVIEGRMTPTYLHAIFDYPFRQLQVQKIYCPIVETNKRSLRLCRKMGFTLETTLKDAHPEGNLHLFSLNRQDCRFLGVRDGIKERTATGT